MCGVAGWVSFDRDLTHKRETIDEMTSTLACRGPDEQGVFVSTHALLGHRRLSVIDPPGGKQPMRVDTPGGAVVLVHGGEIYNYRELRDELIEHGDRFTTDSDTEVVLRGYLRWGDFVTERLNGMYAFAIWDERSSRLLLVRDRMGLKPFFFYRTADGVLFGSEPKAILANSLATRALDLDGLREMLAFVMTPGHAMWSGMNEIEPGTAVSIDKQGLRTQVYWRLTSRPHSEDLTATLAHVRELLDDIVQRQLVSDVPLCMLLSGGLDSSAITGLAARTLGGRNTRTFSVDFVGHTEHFEANDFHMTPDAPYVHDMAVHVGCDHEDIVLDPDTLADPEIRRTVVRARDLPHGFGEMDFSLYLLFKAIRERSTVALSGDAGDEVFAGYQQFHLDWIQRAHQFPWIAINLGPLDRDGTGLRGDLLSRLDLDGYRQARYREAITEIERLDSDDDFEYRQRIMSHLHLTRFLRYMLERSDRLSMAAGLEVRVPYCDHRLVEYVHNTPWPIKNFDGREKCLLRDTVRDVLPKSVINRLKSPYPSVQNSRYTADIQRQAKELLGRRGHGVFELVDHRWLADVTSWEPSAVDKLTRLGLERTLSLAVWFDLYNPDVRLD